MRDVIHTGPGESSEPPDVEKRPPWVNPTPPTPEEVARQLQRLSRITFSCVTDRNGHEFIGTPRLAADGVVRMVDRISDKQVEFNPGEISMIKRVPALVSKDRKDPDVIWTPAEVAFNILRKASSDTRIDLLDGTGLPHRGLIASFDKGRLDLVGVGTRSSVKVWNIALIEEVNTAAGLLDRSQFQSSVSAIAANRKRATPVSTPENLPPRTHIDPSWPLLPKIPKPEPIRVPSSHGPYVNPNWGNAGVPVEATTMVAQDFLTELREEGRRIEGVSVTFHDKRRFTGTLVIGEDNKPSRITDHDKHVSHDFTPDHVLRIHR